MDNDQDEVAKQAAKAAAMYKMKKKGAAKKEAKNEVSFLHQGFDSGTYFANKQKEKAGGS